MRVASPDVGTLVKRAVARARGARAGGFRGGFRDWPSVVAAAARAGPGYSAPAVLSRVRAATREVIAGRALFERDSVLFHEGEPPYPLLACLLGIAVRREGYLAVADVGGSLGSVFRQCRPFLAGLRRVRWMVVEQPEFVAAGKAEFETAELRFFDSISACVGFAPPDVAIFSGVLQYLADPHAVVAEAATTGADILVDRLPTVDETDDGFAIQTVPPAIYRASLPLRLFGAASLHRLVPAGYRLAATFRAVDPDTRVDGVPVTFRGFHIRKGGLP
jgi:putative methyltransferase (TIGR04325 family)